ncbi:TPA: SET domain-containing protein [Candidatus Woesearchaeota archaeon]|nr:SET domain-containing protein [Candidatus Woesearchaeota archaeon]
MLLVNTKVLPSNIHGMGLFADEFIPKGTVIWKFTPGFDLKFTKEQIAGFPEQVREYLHVYSWLSKKSGAYCFSSDNGKYFNHSEHPNSLSAYYEDEDEVVTRAIKDIQCGDEITDDYSTFEKDFKEDWSSSGDGA